MKTLLHLNINGQDYEIYTEIHKTLLEVLREDLALTGTKHGCELGECGTCTILVNGKPKLSCLTLPIQVQGDAITTIEGLAESSSEDTTSNNHLHPLQESFANLGAAQCGYCSSAMLLSAKALLDEIPHPTQEQIKAQLAGNLCRCTGYTKIIQAVENVAQKTQNVEPGT